MGVLKWEDFCQLALHMRKTTCDSQKGLDAGEVLKSLTDFDSGPRKHPSNVVGKPLFMCVILIKLRCLWCLQISEPEAHRYAKPLLNDWLICCRLYL